ncbi:MAG TPA: oxygen-dependent coproporphyrinogen oxidase [Steroidobacteraceae bacterium]|nr:oxygen-dependent coproporphyrinogen oxidase [Steroidobacteraceae bacterium]
MSAAGAAAADVAERRAGEVRAFLGALQDELCSGFAAADGVRAFARDPWQRAGGAETLAGDGITAVLEDGALFERGGVALSDVRGTKLPPAATARNPQLAGRPFRAMGVSVVMHPRNPQVPTSHMNVRYFSAGDVWWFGGGFDLTPYLPFEEDAAGWHRAAAAACAPFHADLYPRLRRTCDEYFYLKHRGEARGVGGIFYDDLNADTPDIGMPWERCFEFMRAVGRGYLAAYAAIVRLRNGLAYGERERRYQLYRRGRYAEFNLLLDRGTLFGLQSGGRTDAILMSMPPCVHWAYRSPDAELDARLLPLLTTRRGHDWLGGGASS